MGIPPAQESKSSRCYAAGSTPVAVRQEGFLVTYTFRNSFSFSFESAGIYKFQNEHHDEQLSTKRRN